MEIAFSVGKCKTKAAFSAKLKQPRKIDLMAIRKKYDIVLETPILLVINVEDREIIVHSYGEIMFKEGGDMVWMERVAREIYTLGLE